MEREDNRKEREVFFCWLAHEDDSKERHPGDLTIFVVITLYQQMPKTYINKIHL